jgi:adenylosuccinate synthase
LATSLQKQYNFQHNTQEELERFKQYRETLKPLVTDTAYMVNAALDAGKSVLAEGTCFFNSCGRNLRSVVS